MKQFCCGDVVPGCKAMFHARTEEDMFLQIAAHARADHAITEISPALVQQVRQHIHDVNAAA
jgi:predicted small metal-binding protein